MSSVLAAVADAVASRINAGSFSIAVTAVRTWQPAFTLEDLDQVKVSVVPRSVEVSASTRESSYYDVAVDVGVQQKLDATDNNAIDALVQLAEEIVDHLRLAELDDYPAAHWLSISHDPVVAAEHLAENRQFTSIITTTYRLRR